MEFYEINPMNEKPEVTVALSGGVDSSVTAALLLDEGYSVNGMMLRLWNGDPDIGTSKSQLDSSIERANDVCSRLGIPFEVVDSTDEFKNLWLITLSQATIRDILPTLVLCAINLSNGVCCWIWRIKGVQNILPLGIMPGSFESLMGVLNCSRVWIHSKTNPMFSPG